MPASGNIKTARRWLPEIALALVAFIIFFGFLGSMEIWGKREQRSAAETIDTIQESHWLVARIQGRPRLEKPPLPRWIIAGLMTLTGRRDEGIVRLPSAASAVGMVAVTYGLGSLLGGRVLALAAGFLLCSMPFFIAEMRQAGNDGPLAFFTAIAIYAAWRRLHPRPDPTRATTEADLAAPPARGSWHWLLLMNLALGLGFLTKGPIIVLVAALAILPSLAIDRQFRSGLRALWSPWGSLLFLLLALSWPVPVVLADPEAVKVWLLEMGQKAGSAGIEYKRDHHVLAFEWFWMAAPWCILGLPALFWPILMRRKGTPPPGGWMPWCWTVLNLLMFCTWRVAKPNYFLPCMPGVALLIAGTWLHVSRVARGSDFSARLARPMLQGHWVFFFVAALILPVLMQKLAPDYLVWSVILTVALLAAVITSAWAWRKGRDVVSMAAFVGAMSVAVLVGYGAVIPSQNASRSHRGLAQALDRVLPPEVHTVMFFHELDEGLWFYLRDRDLKPVPGSAPRYNDGFEMLEQYRNKSLLMDPQARLDEYKQKLLGWIGENRHESPYVLIRASRFDSLADDLAGRIEVLHREQDVKRHGLVLFRVLEKKDTEPAATASQAQPAGAAGTPVLR